MVDSWAHRYGQRPHTFFEDPFAAMIDATIMDEAEKYHEAAKHPGMKDVPLDAESVRIRGLRQAGAFEEMLAKLAKARGERHGA